MNNQINKRERERDKKFLAFLGFKLVNGTSDKYSKEYKQHKYSITCDFDKNIIDYGNLIEIGRATTSNLQDSKRSIDESLVVLECVNKLLEKGYKPEDISLEIPFKAGTQEKGQWLDIMLKKDDVAFALIECKTFGKEHRQERQKMNKHGGQLFSYFANQTDAKYLILYSTSIETPDKNECDIIKTDIFKDCTNNAERMKVWDRTTESNGFFESELLYDFNAGLRKKNLMPISYDDIYSTVKNSKDVNGTIFNRFAEILRRHTVSDKTNSYNKIFNLFLCKIIDEDSSSEDKILDFQWKNNETAEEVISRLSTLYKKGMQKYMELDVTDHTEKEFEEQLKNLSDKQEAVKMFQEIRLYKNNEFAFKEVINKRTFDENAKVVKEAVKLLEKYQIKYSCKQAFLGDFFERLLNIGIKQEAGQFFTPVPIARFIVNSIPFEKVINQKINDGEKDFLPRIIDYACGSGHFLTEGMDRLQNIIDEKINTTNLTQGQKSNISFWQTNKETNVAYNWAKDYIYGIEKDYRLVKTTKIACFLNGDGEANIIYGDGLESFGSEYYRGVLKEKHNKENKQFDVVIANPPFSVECFKETLENGAKDFELFNALGDRSDDIECLFIERTAQLLKDDGICAIILPSTILTNGGIHSKARRLFIENFELRAIQKLHGGVFAATPNTTIVLFGIRRKSRDITLKNIDKLLQEYLSTKLDINYNQNQNVISKYCSIIETTFEDFTAKITTDESFKKDQLQRLKFFLLTNAQPCLIGDYDAKSEKGKLEKIFLGYEHSGRQKYEGIHPFPKNAEGKINSKLYTDNNPLDERKVSSYIHKILSGEKIDNTSIDEGLQENIHITTLEKLVNWEERDFSFFVNVDNYKNNDTTTNWKYTAILFKDIKDIKIHKGSNAPQEEKYFLNGTINFVRAGHLNNKNLNYLDISRVDKINQLAYEELKINTVPKNTILFPISGQSVNTNNIVITPERCCIVNHLVGISITNEILLKFIFYFLSYYKTSNLSPHGSYPAIKIEAIESLKIPLPPLEIQQQIIDEISQIEQNGQKVEREIRGYNVEISGYNVEISNLIEKSQIDGKRYKFTDLIAEIDIEKLVKIPNNEILTIGKYPVITQEQEFISGYTNEETGLISDVPLIIFGDHSLSLKYIDFPFFFGADGIKLIKTNKIVSAKYFYYLLKSQIQTIATGKYQRHYSSLKEMTFIIPSQIIQKSIVQDIEMLENKITKLEMTLKNINTEKEDVIVKYLIL